MRQKLNSEVGVKPGLNGVLFPNHKEHGYEGNNMAMKVIIYLHGFMIPK